MTAAKELSLPLFDNMSMLDIVNPGVAVEIAARYSTALITALGCGMIAVIAIVLVRSCSHAVRTKTPSGDAADAPLRSEIYSAPGGTTSRRRRSSLDEGGVWARALVGAARNI